jgi:metal-responsive CopG/Arc/MetJ family transcriptional regulator
MTYNTFYRGGFRMAVNKEKNTQILVTFTKEQVEQIENYWHENRLKNRNEAMRQLIEKEFKS